MIIFSLVGVGALFFAAAPILSSSVFVSKPLPSQSASAFFVESAKSEVLKQTLANPYNPNSKIRVLVVPGHDNDFWGTEFKGVKEADMTLSLGKELTRLLSEDGKFEVVLTRDDSGYTPVFSSYFVSNAEEISLFVKTKKQIMSNLISLGEVYKSDNKIFHNNAPLPVVSRLFGINKWANENNIDLVVHIHFNDYPRRKAGAGQYSGFSIYVPERQYSNARASKDIALAVSKRLQAFYPDSNMPKEDVGVVEDQDLIAIGAFNTVDPAALLIEYGYIYEPQFLEPVVRVKIINELATQTYIGIRDFFEGTMTAVAGKYNTTLLPYSWENPIEPGTQHDPSVLSLQAALLREGVYPPKEFDLRDCPLAGTYGRCTWQSLALFQQKYGIGDEPGRFGEATREKLNQLYGE